MLGFLLTVALSWAAHSAVTLSGPADDVSVGLVGDVRYAFGSMGQPPPMDRFQPATRWQFGTRTDTLWVRLNVTFDTGLSPGESFYIEVDEHPDRARLYRDGDFSVPLSATGALLRMDERPLNNQRILLRAGAEPGKTVTYFVAMDSVLPLSGFLRVFGTAGLSRADHLRDVKVSLFVGFMFAMLLLNLLLYRYTRESLYLYYAALQPWYFIFPLWEIGYGYVVIPQAAPYYQFLGNLIGQTAVFALAVFVTRISELRRKSPQLNAGVLALALLGVLVVFIIPAPTPVFSAISAATFLTLLYIGVRAIREGDRASRFWTAGLLLMITCAIFFICAEQGLLTINLNLEDIVHILAFSAVFDSIAFALSISERLNQSMQVLIDKQSELIRRLEVKRQAAEVSNIAKEQFLMNTNHELQTPLTAMIGFADMILERVGDPERHAGIIKRSALRLTQILKDIVDFSSTKRGTIVLSLSEFDVCVILEEVLELLAPEAQRRKIFVRNENDDNFQAFVRADRARTRQILWNVLGNAVRFTERGEIHVGVKKDNDAVRIWVRDTGVGIEPTLHDQIFAGFTQTDSTTKRAQHGLGLGLALSRELAQIQGGDVKLIWSEVDRGSEFEVRLPTPTTTHVAITETTMRAAWLSAEVRDFQ